MQFDLVIPTRGDLKTITPLFQSLNTQTLLPEHIFLIVDKLITEHEWEVLGEEISSVASEAIARRLTSVTNVTHDFQPGGGAAYTRNYGIHMATSKYLYLIDDDNIFGEEFFETSLREYQEIAKHDTLLYSPMIGRRQTDRIQSVGIRQFHYRLSRPEPILG